jgi:hypothetical protein
MGGTIADDLIATINCNYDELKSRIILANYHTVDIQDFPSDICVLPNGNLMIVSYHRCLSIYDQSFNLIKKVDEINNIKMKPHSVVTNNIDKIYINDFDKILMTNLEFQYLNKYITHESSLELNPSYILFHNDHLYVCDADNKCMKKLDSDLKLCVKYVFEFQPKQLTIINNLACIITFSDGDFYFYDLNELKIKYQYSNSQFSLVYKDNFFVLGGDGSCIDCYNKNGSLINSISLYAYNDFYETVDGDFNFITIFNDKLLIYFNYKKLFVV